MAFSVRPRALWVRPLLLFASVVLLGSLAFAIANLDRADESLPPAFPLPGGGSGAVPFAPSGEQLQVVWQALIVVLFITAIVASLYARKTNQKTVWVWELMGYAFGIGVIGGIVMFWPTVLRGLETLGLTGGSLRSPATGATTEPRSSPT